MTPSASHPDTNVRASVLAAAIEIVENEGLGALSMREVARRAGVSHQAPYHYFADRGDVLAHIAIDGFDRLSEAMSAALAGPGDPAEESFGAYVRFALAHPAHFRIMFRPELCMVETHAGAKAAADRAMGVLMMLVRRVAPSTISELEAFDWAVFLWSQVHGTATLVLDGPLTRKLPPGRSLDDMVASVARLAAAAIHGI